jgi:hypothetical protein
MPKFEGHSTKGLENRLSGGSKADRLWPVCATLGLGFTQALEPPRLSFQPGTKGLLDIRPALDPPVRNAG